MTTPTAWHWPHRLVTRAQVRRALQLTDAELTDRMRRGQLPGPIWGCDAALDNARWDVVAIDAAIGRESTIKPPLAADEEALDNALGIRRA